MPELLVELFSEEIPARMQRKAAEDLKKAVTNALVDAGLVYEGAKAFFERWAHLDDNARAAIAAMEGIPVDIRPLYPERI